MSGYPKTEPATLVVLGATGDLAQRKLYPALYRLMHREAMDERTRILGAARRADLDDPGFGRWRARRCRRGAPVAGAQRGQQAAARQGRQAAALAGGATAAFRTRRSATDDLRISRPLRGDDDHAG